jgi:hypothetical protein
MKHGQHILISGAAMLVALAGCVPVVPPPPQPPFATAPVDSAVQQALMQRLGMTDSFPTDPSSPGNNPPMACAALFTVQSESITQQPVLQAGHYSVEVDATIQATRTAIDSPNDVGAFQDDVSDCFGAPAPLPGWAIGASVTLPAKYTLTYVGPYWLLQDGDVTIPLSSGPSHAFTVKQVTASNGT